jgi:adenylate kinase family enzyme
MNVSVDSDRILIFGNSGSGKTTMARALAEDRDLPHLDLDLIAWDRPGERRALEESVVEIRAFVDSHDRWVVEGCYADLIEAVLPFCTELRFLNPGVEACIANCRSRPWEPEKYGSAAEQDAMLEFLLSWVREYETRADEFSLRRHRQLFDSYSGAKREYTRDAGSDLDAVRDG